MKTNFFLTFLSVVLASLVGYLVYNVASGKENDMLCGIFSFICFAATLVPVMGLQFESNGVGVNIRVFSVLFFVLFCVSHFCFAGFGIKMPTYVLVNGILLVVFMAILYKMMGIKSV
ncbi:MAG: hypothetical protein Q4E60_04885 [Bacteroidales bacterium]|nr:hypothetical protein [Bacteroidales bacterium]